jgi:CubicO group peptidase (beta-lactamase class C family)
LRELLPKLWAQTGEVVLTPPKLLEAYPTYGEYTSAMFLQYLKLKVFDPIGIKTVGCSDNTTTSTLYYPLNPTISGVVGTDQSLFCGSGGLYLSANEMTKFMVYLFNTQTLLPATARKTMVDRRFGIDGGNSSRGLTLSRVGIVGIASNSEGKGGTKACMIHFHDGIDAALVQNSGDNASINPCSVLIAAYDAAWQ